MIHKALQDHIRNRFQKEPAIAGQLSNISRKPDV